PALPALGQPGRGRVPRRRTWPTGGLRPPPAQRVDRAAGGVPVTWRPAPRGRRAPGDPSQRPPLPPTAHRRADPPRPRHPPRPPPAPGRPPDAPPAGGGVMRHTSCVKRLPHPQPLSDGAPPGERGGLRNTQYAIRVTDDG